MVLSHAPLLCEERDVGIRDALPYDNGEQLGHDYCQRPRPPRRRWALCSLNRGRVLPRLNPLLSTTRFSSSPNFGFFLSGVRLCSWRLLRFRLFAFLDP